jgi:hypothetical protein
MSLRLYPVKKDCRKVWDHYRWPMEVLEERGDDVSGVERQDEDALRGQKQWKGTSCNIGIN